MLDPAPAERNATENLAIGNYAPVIGAIVMFGRAIAAAGACTVKMPDTDSWGAAE
jgi:hypothetical protein